MENNEQMNQQPSYEQLLQAYNNVVRDNEMMRMQLESLRTDKLLEKIKLMLDVIKNKEGYPSEIVNLAKWNAKQMMAKPEEK